MLGEEPNGRAKRKAKDSKEDRWRRFEIAEVRDREFKLDGFKWLKEESAEDSDELPEPEELAAEAIVDLNGAVKDLEEVVALLGIGGNS